MNDIYLVDYHIHTEHSFDSRAKIRDYCLRAVELGVKEIAFTEHFDLNPLDRGLGHLVYDNYQDEIMACRDEFGKNLKIRLGLELGEPHLYHARHKEFLAGKEIDFLIGSVHYIGPDDIGYMKDEFAKRDLYTEYLQEVLRTARQGGFSVLGHMDVLKRYAPDGWRDFCPRNYEELVREILRALIEQGIGLEINTSALRQGFLSPYPDEKILSWYREMGGEIITLGSDAHRVEDLAEGVFDCIQLMQKLGFKYLASYENREPTMHKI